jgi:hypothetical protein
MRVATIKALAECPCSGFTSADLKALEAFSDERLLELKALGEKRKADQDKAAADLKTAQDKAVKDAAKITALEAAIIPEAELTSLRALAADKAKADEARKTALVTALKTAQSVYDEAALTAMDITALENVSKLVKVVVPDYSGRGVVRVASEHTYAPPDAYGPALKALQADKSQTAKAN